MNKDAIKAQDDTSRNAKTTSTNVKPQQGLFALFQKHANKASNCDNINKLQHHNDTNFSCSSNGINANNNTSNNQLYKVSQNKRNAKKGFVRYVYQDGATNAVKMTASIDDFL